MPYDKNGKYYRKPVVREKKGKSVDEILNNANRNANIFVSIVLVGIVGGCVSFYNYLVQDRPMSEDDIKIQKIILCKNLIKANLKDPNSFKYLNGIHNQKETGIIRYSATNSFGGRVQEVFRCFDPSISTDFSQPKNTIDKDYLLELKEKELEEKKYYMEANKCRDSQDTSKDEYFDQSYRECMEVKGYDPYHNGPYKRKR